MNRVERDCFCLLFIDVRGGGLNVYGERTPMPSWASLSNTNVIEARYSVLLPATSIPMHLEHILAITPSAIFCLAFVNVDVEIL